MALVARGTAVMRRTGMLFAGIGARNFRFMSSFAHVKHGKVGIIGGGVAGMQMARSLAAAGIDCTVFDRAPGPGGLWRENYAGYGVQVTKQMYEFPDYPNPAPRFTFPTGAECQKYIEDFVSHFSLGKFLRANTEVKALSHRSDGRRGWTFTVKDLKTGAENQETFDYAIVASGMYSTTINMPELNQREVFEGAGGRVFHSSEFLSTDIAKGKNVVVVGGGKSAIDIVCISSNVAQSATLLFRRPHWGVPQNIAGLIPFHYVFASRLGQALVVLFKGTLYKCAPVLGSIHHFLAPVMRGVFGIVEALFNFQLNHGKGYKPKDDIVTDVYYGAHILTTDFKNKRREGKVKLQQGEIASLEAGALILGDGVKVSCDVLVCATGFKKQYDYLPADTKLSLDVQKDGLYLYRHMIPVGVPDLAFCGSEVATLMNITTHGIQAEWITRMLTGQVTLPSESEMKAEVEGNKAWKRSWMLPSVARGPMVLLHFIHYHQSLLQDMKEKTRRLGGISEYLMPYEGSAYNGIVGKAKWTSDT